MEPEFSFCFLPEFKTGPQNMEPESEFLFSSDITIECQTVCQQDFRKNLAW
jgi:hypothetical protein